MVETFSMRKLENMHKYGLDSSKGEAKLTFGFSYQNSRDKKIKIMPSKGNR